MKIAAILLGIALLIISSILVFLLKNGGALKPAGVIKPAEIGSSPDLIGKSVALRLFPEFSEAHNVIWHLESSDDILAQIPNVAWNNYPIPEKPGFQILQEGMPDNCTGNCWYIQQAGVPLPESVLQKIKSGPSMEIYVQSFNRNESVPEFCEKEKILDPKCVRPVSVREIHRKLKTAAPHFFMQRYQDSQFFLFIEKI